MENNICYHFMTQLKQESPTPGLLGCVPLKTGPWEKWASMNVWSSTSVSSDQACTHARSSTSMSSGQAHARAQSSSHTLLAHKALFTQMELHTSEHKQPPLKRPLFTWVELRMWVQALSARVQSSIRASGGLARCSHKWSCACAHAPSTHMPSCWAGPPSCKGWGPLS